LTGRTYLNPVWPRSFPDPFVLKFRGEYRAYCTGFWEDGRCFGVLRSRDLVDWEPLAGAMDPLPGGHTCYWAPEVTYDNGRFYLYYSVGNEERMEIRVAVADHPEGPFVDSGRRLTSEPFAIDAHVFLDDDGSRHLFYATDFLDRSHIGTGTVRDRLLDPYTLAGKPVPVTLPRYDWHVYHPNRAEKGFVRWHTVEGPFVLKHGGLYYQMFSGGNWTNPTYGVSYAVTDRLDRPGEWEQAADGERVLPILRTIEGKVVGPGHNSVVRGPDNRQLVCVYHRWAFQPEAARVLSIDPLLFEGDRMVVLGPSTEPRPAPPLPDFADFFDGPSLKPAWEVRGAWSIGDNAVRLASGELRLETGTPSFLLEVSLRALEDPSGVGIALDGRRFLMGRDFPLPESFDPRAWHLIRAEVDGMKAEVSLDGAVARWRGRLQEPCRTVSLLAEGSVGEMSGFALSNGR
jgi:GH43 family beta-xylosidase